MKSGREECQSSSVTRSQGGAAGKWQTPAQAKKAGKPVRGGKIEVGDQGVWATCMKAKEGKATEELKVLFETMAEKFYNIKPAAEAELDDEEDEEEDIEAAIAREVAGLAPTQPGGKPKLFQPVFLDVQCVLFFKIGKEIDPVDFCERIAEEAVENPKGRKHRFLNRLSPMSKMGKATEEGLKETGRDVLGKVFRLADDGNEEGKAKEKVSYAIRPTIRNHSQLKRNVVIDAVANLIHDDHKVDLSKPDKTILVEVYQNVCGLAVVDNKWDELKRYNLNELYTPTEARKAEAAAASAAEAGGDAPAGEKQDEEPPVNLNIPRRHGRKEDK